MLLQSPLPQRVKCGCNSSLLTAQDVLYLPLPPLPSPSSPSLRSTSVSFPLISAQIDFVPLHWYGSGSQNFINYVTDMHNTFKRNVWVTEFAYASSSPSPAILSLSLRLLLFSSPISDGSLMEHATFRTYTISWAKLLYGWISKAGLNVGRMSPLPYLSPSPSLSILSLFSVLPSSLLHPPSSLLPPPHLPPLPPLLCFRPPLLPLSPLSSPLSPLPSPPFLTHILSYFGAMKNLGGVPACNRLITADGKTNTPLGVQYATGGHS